MEVTGGNYDNQNFENEKERHGCVTAWIVLMIIANSIGSLTYFFAGDMVSKNNSVPISDTIIMILGLIGLANIGFAVMLLKWKKLGFWGFLLTTIVALSINLSIGLGIGASLAGVAGIIILYAVLQIKKDNVPAWENLE